ADARSAMEDLAPYHSATAERKRADLARIDQIKGQIRRIALNDPRKAEAILSGPEAKRLMDDSDQEEARGIIAQAYLALGDAKRALDVSTSGRGASRPGV